MSTAAAAETALSDWDSDWPLHTGIALPRAGPLVPALVAGAVVALPAGLKWGAAVAALVAAGGFLWLSSRGRSVLRGLDARRLRIGEEPRVANLVEGLSGRLGAPPPSLWLLPRESPNFLVAWSRGGHLAVSTGLLEACSRTQLEAVVAHAMVRLASGEARRATMAVGWGPLASTLVRVGPALDVRAAAVTRYPPALAAAIRLCEPLGGRAGPLWFVGSGPEYAGREDRAEFLLDL